MNRKYSSFMYRNYLTYALENNENVIPLAPPDWEARAKKSYVVNTLYLSSHIKRRLGDPRLETTVYVLNKLAIIRHPDTTLRFVSINDTLFLDPFFRGISENMFFNSRCYIPPLGLSHRSLAGAELKVSMLGGRVVKTPHADIDILLCGRSPSSKTLRQVFENEGIDRFKNMINTTTLNQIFRHYFLYTPFRPE